MVAVQPTLATSDYRCQECGQQHSADLVNGLEEELAEMLHMTSKHDMGARKNISNYHEKYLRNVLIYFYCKKYSQLAWSSCWRCTRRVSTLGTRCCSPSSAT